MKTTPEPTKSYSKVWLIDPETRTISERDSQDLPSLIPDEVGADAECLRLDGRDHVLWVSDTDTNFRHAYYFEGMDHSFNVRRFSKAVLVSMGENRWDVDTIRDYLRWYDRNRVWW